MDLDNEQVKVGIGHGIFLCIFIQAPVQFHSLFWLLLPWWDDQLMKDFLIMWRHSSIITFVQRSHFRQAYQIWLVTKIMLSFHMECQIVTRGQSLCQMEKINSSETLVWCLHLFKN